MAKEITMSEWISVEEKYPETGAKVWYYFEETGVSQGEFYGFEPCYDRCVGLSGESYTSRISVERWKPPCVIRESCGGLDYFGGERGVLGGDVTHWMPDTGQDQPDNPEEIE